MQKIVVSKRPDQWCAKCGNGITELGQHKFTGKSTNTPTTKEELCTCGKCGKEFLLHYDFFDQEGHINSYIFIGDVNDAAYNWQDQLTAEQKGEIGKHLGGCPVCRDRLDHEVITDAWLASLIHSK